MVALLALVTAPSAGTAVRGEAFLRVIGREQLVFDSGRAGCDAADIPDLPARAIRDFHGRIQIVISHYVNRRLVGSSFDQLAHPCAVIMGSAKRDDARTFADRQWLASLYTLDGKNVVALVHDEFQGHLHPGQCRSGAYQRCWYNAITFAVSHDGGASYSQPRPPKQLVAAIPQRYRRDAGPAGMFAPSNIVRNPRDGYFYVLARLIGYGGSPRGTCVLRTRDLTDPRSWRAWDGYDFSVRFASPYLTPVGRFCQPVSKADIGEMDESLTFSTALGRFLLIGVSSVYDSTQGRPVTGMYYSVSDDLIHWTRRTLLLEASSVHTYQCGGPNPIAYPSVIDPSSPSRSFDTSGARAYLYFTRFHYEDCRQTLNRDLVRVPIAISRGRNAGSALPYPKRPCE